MRLLRALVVLAALSGGAASAQDAGGNPIENCLPGSSCWARLQSVEALGTRTAEVAKEVERLAKRDPDLTRLSAQLGKLHGELREIDSKLLLRQQIDAGALEEALKLLRRSIVSVQARDGGFDDYGPVLAELEELADQIDAARRKLYELTPAGLDTLVRSIELLAQRLASMPPPRRADPKDPDSVPAGRAAAKISVRDRLADVYGPDAAFRIAVMAVPDPRIPRYRRSFDLTIEATMRAMSAHAAHPDRFDFPWMKDQKPPCWTREQDEDAEIVWGSKSCHDPREAGLDDLGLMTFRKDCRYFVEDAGVLCGGGRGTRDSKVQILALYLVPERGTDGPDHHAAVAALRRSAVQAAGVARLSSDRRESSDALEASGAERAQWLLASRSWRLLVELSSVGRSLLPADEQTFDKSETEKASDARSTVPTVTLLAPINSSAIGPWSKALSASDRGAPVIRWLSATATALPHWPSHEPSLASCTGTPEWIRTHLPDRAVRALACSDIVRLEQLIGRFGRDRDVFAENSRYGDLPLLEEDGEIEVVRFSPGIWELQLQSAGTGSSARTSGSRMLSSWERKFARELLFDEKDRGDEMPQRFAHAVGSRTQELAFDQAMLQYVALRNRKGSARRPTLIVASDVRDQLVVARAVRVADPDAQLVFFDADELLAHPAYVGATRGAMVAPAGGLVQCGADRRMHRFAKDEMALVFRALHVWLDPGWANGGQARCADSAGPQDAESAQQGLMIVTRAGLRSQNEFAALRWREVGPQVAVALVLAMLFVWSTHGGRGYVEALRVDKVMLGWPLLLAVLSLMAGLAGLMSPASVEHVGPGVSLALAWTLLMIALAMLACAVSWARFSEGMRSGTRLLDPGALSRAPPFWGTVLAVVTGFALHVVVSGGIGFGASPGPSFAGRGLVYHLLPWLATGVSLFAALALGMAYRGWALLRRDAALCDIRFSTEFARTWVGSTALRPYATPYVARHDQVPNVIAQQSHDFHGTANRRRILACDISAIRAWLHGSIAAAMLGVLAVQAFPMAGHARLLQINLLVGLLGVGFSLMLLVGMARNELLSTLFTGKNRLEFGPRFITLAATSLLIGAGLLYLAIAPDGSEWYDDLFVPLLSWMKM